MDNGDQSHKYTMRVSRLTIEKLGIRLYDRVSAVPAELIANSYDADATKVEVTLPWGVTLAGTIHAVEHEPYRIVVRDNGHGMTSEEINAHYLMVGSDRRVRIGSDLSRRLERPARFHSTCPPRLPGSGLHHASGRTVRIR
ncbi:ATP-binding protein [Nocardia sp. CWNU-33]|uniref:ATP-binding protein n=1 Tax=Nocardia sp. CWNU-33 TaxID=3392117 RepID=UPI00398E3EC1